MRQNTRRSFRVTVMAMLDYSVIKRLTNQDRPAEQYKSCLYL